MTVRTASFDDLSTNFLSWFNAQPGTTFHQSINIKDLRGRNAGRGIVATANIPANADLFIIPRSIVIKAEGSRLAQKIPGVFDEWKLNDENEDELSDNVDEIPNSWINIILVLMFEFLQHDSSPWAPYLDILPQSPNEFNTMMFWTSEELEELQSSHVASKIGRQTADKIFRKRILPIVTRHGADFYPDSTSSYLDDHELLQMAHCIGSLIMSYAFELQPDVDSDASSADDGDEEDGWKEDIPIEGTMGMVPMADMLNADAEFNAHLSHGDDVLTMTSIREIKAGEQILNYYGPLPNAELCRRYGYTSTRHAVYDVVEIPWPIIKQYTLEEFDEQVEPTRSRLLRRISNLEETHGLGEETFVVERETGGPDDNGTGAVPGVFQSPPEEYVSVMTDIFEGANGRLAGVKEQKIHILSIFLRTLTARLAQYGTTTTQDESLETQASGRIKMAIDIRRGEKILIKEAIAWTELKLQSLRNRPRPREERSSNAPRKRQKR